MGKYEFIKTPISGLIIVKTTQFKDERGFFIETYNEDIFRFNGITERFVQDNHSHSKKGVLRGLHFQFKHPQGKLVRVVKGRVFDVAVDLRKDSPTFGKWFGVELSEENHLEFYIPPHFAHGFLSLEDDTEFLYKCTDFYYPDDEGGIIWNDPQIGIEWPVDKVQEITISGKDKKLPKFEEVIKYL